MYSGELKKLTYLAHILLVKLTEALQPHCCRLTAELYRRFYSIYTFSRLYAVYCIRKISFQQKVDKNMLTSFLVL